jgi:hypothetical protein
MKTFKQYLSEEVKWTQGAFYQLFYKEVREQEGCMIPLQHSLIEKTIGTVPMYAAHVLGVNNLQNLIKIQNKRGKQISAFTAESGFGPLTSGGVWGGAGIVAILKGYAMAGGATDIMSVVDKKGTRFIDVGSGSYMNSKADDFGGSLAEFEEQVDDLKDKIFQNEMKSNKDIQEFVEGDFNFSMDAGVYKQSDLKQVVLYWIDNNDNMAKSRMIRAFYEGIVPIMKKHKKILHDVLLEWVKEQAGPYRSQTLSRANYDEIVLSNFKIIKLIVTTNEAGGLATLDQAKATKIPVVETLKLDVSRVVADELKTLTRNNK